MGLGQDWDEVKQLKHHLKAKDNKKAQPVISYNTFQKWNNLF